MFSLKNQSLLMCEGCVDPVHLITGAHATSKHLSISMVLMWNVTYDSVQCIMGYSSPSGFDHGQTKHCCKVFSQITVA